jgi:2-amino-4-hydroxy-6-hydroxymethyldihydropteridine diphosphokinase
MANVYIGVGSNLNNPFHQVTTAISELEQIRKTRFVYSSSIYKSEPLGESDQPDYINAVAMVDTSLSPVELLDELQNIEDQHQRVRGNERWIARTLDLDILLYSDYVIDSERLVIPHYHMKHRNFVLVPLLEIAPKLELPDGSILSEMPLATDLTGLQKL